MNKVTALFEENSKVETFARGYFNYLSEILAKMDCEAVSRFIECIKSAHERDSQVFFIGNGGSAATASHFANDLSIGTRSPGQPFRVISLTDNVAVMTAIGNDYGYDCIFEMQLKALMKPNDVVVAISASGNSPNLIKAIDYAKAHGGITVGLTGFDGGRLKEICQVNVHVPSSKGEYGPVEDIHMILDHVTHAYLSHWCKLGKGERS